MSQWNEAGVITHPGRLLTLSVWNRGIRWVLATVRQLRRMVHLLSCSPTTLSPDFSSDFRSPALSADGLPSSSMGKTEAFRQVLLHLTTIQYTTTHIWTHCLCLLSNSVEEGALLCQRPILIFGSQVPSPMTFSKDFLLQFALFSLHLRFLPKVTLKDPHLLVFMLLHIFLLSV